MELLREFLTAYEAQAYRSLVQHGVMTASEVAKHSGVPYGKVYPVLEMLVKKGAAKRYAGRPQRFIAVEPAIIARQAVERKEAEARQLKHLAQRFLKEAGELGRRNDAQPVDRIRIVEGYRNYLRLSVALHKEARAEWLSISELSLYKPHIDAYRENVRSGVRVRVLTSREEATPQKLAVWRKTGAQIRFMERLPTKFSVIDHNDVTVRLAEGDAYVSVWIRNPSLNQSMRTYFELLWSQAQER